MSDVGTWSANAEKNNKPAPNGWPENMLPSDVNNSARENMAAIKRMSLDFPYFGIGGKVVWVSDTSFSIEDDELDTEYRKYYTESRQVKIKYLNELTQENITAVVSSSLYSANVSTITVRFDTETGKLPTTTYAVMVGLRFEDVKGTAGPNMLGMVLPYTADPAKIPFGMGLANGEPFDPMIYSELAILYKTGMDEDGNIYLYGRKNVNGRFWPLKPDVRGLFPRFLSMERTETIKDGDKETQSPIDKGRLMNTVQGDAIRNITGTFSAVKKLAYESMPDPTGVFSQSGERSSSGRTGDGHWPNMYTYTLDVSKTLPTAEENRPKNIAFPGLLIMYGGYANASLIKPEDLVDGVMSLVDPKIEAINTKLTTDYNEVTTRVNNLVDGFDTVVSAGVDQINVAGTANMAAMDAKVAASSAQADRSKYYAETAAASTVGKQAAIKTIVVSVKQTDWDVNKVAVIKGLPIKSVNDTIWVAPYALTDENFKAYAEAQIRGTTITAGASDNSGTLSLKCINVPAPGTTVIAVEVSIANASN